MNPDLQYDYIIAGAGCAGLSLAMHLMHSGEFSQKKILLVDADAKKSNDRTWCFWQAGEGIFEPIVYRQWQKLWFHGPGYEDLLNISPYRYKMIRGIDFYEHCLERLGHHPNFSFSRKRVDSVFSNDAGTGVMIEGQPVYSQYVFNSILFDRPVLTARQYWLLQHFKGWIIETEEDRFDEGSATLMDFRISQEHGTAFCYVLPFSSRLALVEYTLFSRQQLTPAQYDEGLRSYVADVLKLQQYRIADEEAGVIPMTNFPFSPGHNNLVNIGTAGGQTKGSSGYTFNFIQKHSEALVKKLSKGKHPLLNYADRRFAFYDSVLLNILHHDTLPGRDVFTRLFKNNKAGRVLKFLHNETSLVEDLSIITSLPTWPFMKAAVRQLV
ncbi:MAG TPA: lycopene cyclase family protein [Flavisolibacter sp.]|nr:lycopene cyclase family protein [Flavisolibacter sp.]